MPIPLDHILVLGIRQMLTGQSLLQLVHHNISIVDPHLCRRRLVTVLLASSVEGVDLLLQRRELRVDVGVAHVRLPRTLCPSARRSGDRFAAAVLAQILKVLGVALGRGFRRIPTNGKLREGFP